MIKNQRQKKELYCSTLKSTYCSSDLKLCRTLRMLLFLVSNCSGMAQFQCTKTQHSQAQTIKSSWLLCSTCAQIQSKMRSPQWHSYMDMRLNWHWERLCLGLKLISSKHLRLYRNKHRRIKVILMTMKISMLASLKQRYQRSKKTWKRSATS
jgi:hypothetical protein